MAVDISSGAANFGNAIRAGADIKLQQTQEKKARMASLAKSVGTAMADAQVMARIEADLERNGLDKGIAKGGPLAAARAIYEKQRQEAQFGEDRKARQDAGIQKELDRGYEEGRAEKQRADLAGALNLPANTPAAAAPLLYRDAQEQEANKQFSGLVAPGKTLSHGGFLNFTDTPATPGLVQQRYGSGKSPMLGRDDLKAALEMVTPPAPKEFAPRNIDPNSSEGIAAAVARESKLKEAGLGPYAPKEGGTGGPDAPVPAWVYTPGAKVPPNPTARELSLYMRANPVYKPGEPKSMEDEAIADVWREASALPTRDEQFRYVRYVVKGTQGMREIEDFEALKAKLAAKAPSPAAPAGGGDPAGTHPSGLPADKVKKLTDAGFRWDGGGWVK